MEEYEQYFEKKKELSLTSLGIFLIPPKPF